MRTSKRAGWNCISSNPPTWEAQIVHRFLFRTQFHPSEEKKLQTLDTTFAAIVYKYET